MSDFPWPGWPNWPDALKAHFYILDGRTPVEEPSMTRWCEWMATADRHVKFTEQGDIWISTVFLGHNARFFGMGTPFLFETMAFRGQEVLDWQRRYATWEAAEIGHDAVVREVFASAGEIGEKE